MNYLFVLLFVLFFMMPQKSVAGDYSSMLLVGKGEYRYIGMFKVYSAEFYSSTVSAEPLAPKTDRCLVFQYEVEITAEQFAKAASTILTRQFNQENLASLTNDINRMHEAYRDVQEGDRYSLCYRAQSQTTSLSLNGEQLVAITSEPFASMYFSIWLGDYKPLDISLRDNLLSGMTSATTRGGS